MMKILRLIITLMMLTPAHADEMSSEAANLACFSPQETRRNVAMGKVVPPALVMRKARQSMPNSDILRARLCHANDGPVYVITVLRHDGRVVNIMMEALTR
jgi:uncharacterized membrane protein YkoI